MSLASKRRSQPAQPDAFATLMDDVENLLTIEHNYTPQYDISLEGHEYDDITAISRNRSINVLRCLKMWYDLSSDVFIVAVNIVDRFLSKMKVQSKHIACVAVSSLYIAGDLLNETMNPDDLVNISQSKCTTRDLQRMSNIIKDKLNVNNTIVPITTLQFFRLYHKLLAKTAEKLDIGSIYNCVINEQDMYIKLELIACDMRCSSDLPSLLALVLIFIQLEQIIFGKHLKSIHTMKFLHLYAFAVELKKFCNINENEFSDCIKKVSSVLNLYNGKLKVSYRQRLIWKVSRRTMKQLRPTRQLLYTLPTIVEDSSHH